MSNFVPSTPLLGIQPIGSTSTTQNHPLGFTVEAIDATLGGGEFIYLKGVVSTVVGSAVTYSTADYLTALAAVGTHLPQPIAFAMSANVASQYGWYQISGNAVAVKTSGLAIGSNVAVGILTIGKIALSGTGKEVEGALTLAKATTPKTVTLVINRPVMQGRVT